MDKKTQLVEAESKLNLKQLKFVREYIINGFNAQMASKKAGYSERTAGATGCMLLKNPKVARYIEIFKEIKKQEYDISEKDFITELKRIAFGKLSNFIKISPIGFTFKEGLSDLEKDEAFAMIDTISCQNGAKGFGIQIKLRDKIKALQMLGEIAGFLKAGDGRNTRIKEREDSKEEVIKKIQMLSNDNR